MAMAQYCSSGFRPLPSGTLVISRPTASTWNGLATKAFMIRKNTCVAIRVAVTKGMMARCLRRLVKTTTAE